MPADPAPSSEPADTPETGEPFDVTAAADPAACYRLVPTLRFGRAGARPVVAGWSPWCYAVAGRPEIEVTPVGVPTRGERPRRFRLRFEERETCDVELARHVEASGLASTPGRVAPTGRDVAGEPRPSGVTVVENSTGSRAVLAQGYDYDGVRFSAWAGDGTEFHLTPLYRLKPVPSGWEREPSPEFLVRLRTDLWRWAERDGRGRYRLIDREPNLVLTSDHPDAV